MGSDQKGSAPKLTESLISKLRPTDLGGQEFADHEVIGLRLRVGKNRKTWILRKRAGAKVVNKVLGHYPGMTLKDARRAARGVADGLADGANIASAPVFEHLLDRFINEHAKVKSKSWRDQKRRLEIHVLPAWRGKKIDTIKRAAVQALVDGIAETTEIAANRTLASLKVMFKFAMRKGLLDANPADAVEKPGKEVARDRYLDEAEIKALWRATDMVGYPFGPFVKSLLLTGQRRTEAASMKWKDIDLGKGEWILAAENTKSNRQHLVPLSPPVVAILSALPVIGDEGFIFTSGKSYLRGYSKPKERLDAFMAAELQKDGRTFKGWTLHDLRRTAATHMSRLGLDESIISKILNHSAGSSVTARVYNLYSYAAEKRHALDIWGAEVMGMQSEILVALMAETSDD